MGKKLKKREKSTIVRNQLLSTLRKIYLGGAINECVLTIEGGVALAEVVDITNNIIVLTKTASVASKGVSLHVGLGNIETVIKFLGSINTEKIFTEMSEEKERLFIGNKNFVRKLSYLTSNPEMISTRLRMDEDDEQDYWDQFTSIPEVTFELTKDDAKDLISYIGLNNSKVVTIDVGDSIVFTIGTNTEHKFSIEISDNFENDDEAEFTIKTNGENLAKVLGVVEIDEEEPPVIGLADGYPIVVMEPEVIWGLTPMEEQEGD